jgi:hypothetical protein
MKIIRKHARIPAKKRSAMFFFFFLTGWIIDVRLVRRGFADTAAECVVLLFAADE